MPVALAPRKRPVHRTAHTVWQRLAGEQAVIAYLATQGAAEARRRDAKALNATFDRLRVAILDAIKLHNTIANTWTGKSSHDVCNHQP
jgi:hypothetical protein